MTMDRISVRGLRVFGRHGVLPHEREVGQVFVIDLDLVVDLTAAGRSDDLGQTVDYAALTGRVVELVASRPRTLLEAVAEDVARLALEDALVQQVRVRVAKPDPPVSADLAEVAVEVVRPQPEARR